MKRLIVLALILCWAGCNLANLSDPDSAESKKAQDVLNAAEGASPLVPSPAKEGLLIAIAAAGGILAAFQKKQKDRCGTTTAQIVQGFGDAVTAGAIVMTKDLKTIMDSAQDTVTRKEVDKLQGK